MLFFLLYSILDGFDLGIGMIIPFIKERNEKGKLIALIAPFWDGNEVWLIIAAGFFFALFPVAFASLLSTFYLPFVLTIIAFILRACTLEFSYHDGKRTKLWQTLFSISSFYATFSGLLAVGYLIQGLPIGADARFSSSLADYVSPFPFLFAISAIPLVVWHGLAYALKKNPSKKVTATARKVWLFAVAAFIGLVPFWLFFIRSSIHKPLVWLGAALYLLGLIAGRIYIKKHGSAFVYSCISIGGLWTIIGTGLYPNILISKLNPLWSMSIANCAAPVSTIRLLVILTAVLLPVMLAYTAFIYHIFRYPADTISYNKIGAQ